MAERITHTYDDVEVEYLYGRNQWRFELRRKAEIIDKREPKSKFWTTGGRVNDAGRK